MSEEAKRVAVGFYEAFLRRDADTALSYLGDRYVQHNPDVADGPEAFLRMVEFLRVAYPDSHDEIKRVISEDDLVVIHSHSRRIADEPGAAIMNIFRVENGKVVEHWDVVQLLHRRHLPPANDNGVF